MFSAAERAALDGLRFFQLRIYSDHEREPAPPGPTVAPVGLAQFTRDARPIERFARRDHPNLIAWNVYDCGSRYAARQEPELLAADIRTFFEAVT